MALNIGIDTYITLVEATTYFESRLNTTLWDSATTANKEKALKQATQMIDFRDYKGRRYSQLQILKFPRSGLRDDGVDLDDSEVPQKVKNAQCELAIYLLNDDYTAPDDLANFTNVKVGPLEISTRASSQKPFPPFVIQLLSFATYPNSELQRG
jgi:hypothetical protein